MKKEPVLDQVLPRTYFFFSFLVECWAEAKPEPEIQWYKDGAFINEIDGINIQDLKRLEIAGNV